MGRNASLLVVLVVLVAGIFAWLLGDTGGADAVGGTPTGTEAVAEDRAGPELGQPITPTARRDTDAERSAVPLETAPLDPLAGQLPFHETRVVGRLVDPSGTPLAGQTVELLVSTSRAPSAERARSLDAIRTEREAITDGDGRFEFDEFEAFRSWLYIEARHPSWAPIRLIALDARPGSVHDLGDLRFSPGCSIPVRVTDTDGLGLVGAEVLLVTLPTSGARRGSTPGIAEPAGTTMADGTFQLEGLSVGSYVVGARAPGYAFSWSDTLDLREDAAEVTLALGAGHELRGRVVDRDSGAGIAGAELRITDLNQGSSAYVPLVTGASGEFSFLGAGIGKDLRYVADAEGYLTTWGSLREERNTAGMMVLEVRMPPETQLTVRVVDDETDEPLGDARLYLFDSSWSRTSSLERLGLGTPAGQNPGDTPDLVRTDAAGLASVTTPSNAETLMAAAVGYVTRSVELPRDRTSVSDTPIEVRLQRGSAVEVMVVREGLPAVGAVVELCYVSRNPEEGLKGSSRDNRGWRRTPTVSAAGLAWRDQARLLPAAQAITDDEGVARFPTTPGGLYRAVARSADTCQTVGDPIRVRSADEDHWIELELFPAATIDGRVLLRGEPEPGQRVVAMRDLGPASDRIMSEEAELHTTRSDEDGSFELTGLGPGTWRLFALRPGQAMDPGAAVHSGGVIERHISKTEVVLDIAAGDRRTTDLAAQGPGARLTGRVLLNHEPAAGLLLRMRFIDPEGSRQSSITARTDSAGGYSFEGLIEGDWTVSLTRTIGGRRGGDLYSEGVNLLEDRLRIPDVMQFERDFRIEVGSVLLAITVPDLPPDPKRRQDKISWMALNAMPRGGGGSVMNGWFRAGSPVELVDLPVGSYDLTVTENNVLPLVLAVEVDAGIQSELSGTLELNPKD